MALSTNEKTSIIAAMKAVKEGVEETLTASLAGTLGKQIADLDPATSTDANIVAAYDALKAFRLPSVDSMITAGITEAKAAV